MIHPPAIIIDSSKNYQRTTRNLWTGNFETTKIIKTATWRIFYLYKLYFDFFLISVSRHPGWTPSTFSSFRSVSIFWKKFWCTCYFLLWIFWYYRWYLLVIMISKSLLQEVTLHDTILTLQGLNRIIPTFLVGSRLPCTSVSN